MLVTIFSGHIIEQNDYGTVINLMEHASSDI